MYNSTAAYLGHFRGLAQYPLPHHARWIKTPPSCKRSWALLLLFTTGERCTEYIYNIVTLLQSKGYMTASIDSMRMDSAGATIRLYTGEAYRWAYINTRKIEPALLSAVAWNDRNFSHRSLDFRQFRNKQQSLLDYLENNGYPFAKISLDSVVLKGNGRGVGQPEDR